MIAYVGPHHPRYFERKFIHEKADLFVFQKRHSRSRRVKFVSEMNEIDYFMASHYKHLLIVHSLQYHIPMLYDIKMGLNYTHHNRTVAVLWHKPITHTFERVQLEA